MTEMGRGKNVMLLHGWTCDSHDWSWQLPLFESKYRVVAADLRGHGRSEVMPSGAYTPADYVADIEALISTKYPGQKFIIVGHSMGGQLAPPVSPPSGRTWSAPSYPSTARSVFPAAQLNSSGRPPMI